MVDPSQDCGGCAVFALLRDAIASALLHGSLGQVLTGQAREALPLPGVPHTGQAREALPLAGGHHVITRGHTGQTERDPIKRLARIRGAMQNCLATIDKARGEIGRAARFEDDVPVAVWTEILHHTATIQKEAQKAREILAAIR